MRVLLTGASGHLGGVLHRRLRDAPGIDTIAWVSPRAADDIEGIRVDLARVDDISAAVRDAAPDAIIHLAALTGPACDRDADLARAINVDATRILATAAAERGASRFIFASTAGIYGDAHTSPVDEDTTPTPSGTYATTKLDAEGALEAVGDAHPGFHSIALRIFNIYGAGFADSLVSRLLHSKPAAPVSLRGPDNFIRDYVQSADVCTAVIAALTAEVASPLATINIGTGIATSNADLVEILARAHDVHYLPVEGAWSYSCADITRARTQLDFAPKGFDGFDESR